MSIKKEHYNGFEFIVVNSIEGLKNFANDWNSLLCKESGYLATCSYAWISTYFEVVSAKNSWVCLFIYKNHILVGIIPLEIIDERKYLFNIRYAKLPKNEDTLGVMPLCSNDEAYERIIEAGIDYIWKQYDDLLWIEIGDIPDSSKCNDLASRCLSIIKFKRTGRYIDTRKNQETYQNSLSKNFKKNQNKAKNKLYKYSDVVFSLLEKNEIKDRNYDDFMEIEVHSWKGNQGTAIIQSDKSRIFYKKLTDKLHETGWLKWHFLAVDGKKIAGNMLICINRSILVWKLGYNEEYKNCSPGGMLFQDILDRSFQDDEIDEVNLLTEASWYDNWNMHIRKYYFLRIYNKNSIKSLLLGYFPYLILNKARRPIN